MTITLQADACPQNMHRTLDEALTCHAGILYNEYGGEEGRCPYCHKRTGGIVRNLRNHQRETD